ncbi:MAG TPA: hypothetical protein VEU77_03455 [Candidatus Acidoferrales bacterium]|nr:hypothetical protein [Candidatus Acidoferrales bacterium]
MSSRLTVAILFTAAACSSANPAPSAAAVAASGAREIDLAGTPTPSVVFAFDSIWVGASDKGDLIRLDKTDGHVLRRVPVGDRSKLSARARNYHGVPIAIAAGFGSIWTAGADEMLYRVDPTTGNTSAAPIGVIGTAIAVSDDAVWIAAYDDGELVRFDPAANKITGAANGLGSLEGLTFAFGSVWATSRSGHELLRFDTKTGLVTARIPIDRNPAWVTSGAGAVWVTKDTPRSLVRVDPVTNAITATYPADNWGAGVGVAYADNMLWLGNVARVDPASGKTTGRETTASAEEQLAIAVGGGSLWIVGTTKVRQVPVSKLR